MSPHFQQSTIIMDSMIGWNINLLQRYSMENQKLLTFEVIMKLLALYLYAKIEYNFIHVKGWSMNFNKIAVFILFIKKYIQVILFYNLDKSSYRGFDYQTGE